MATFLSPAVFANEIDLSALPGGSSGIVPAFIGTAKKGLLNKPILVTNAQQYIDNFGEPFSESYLGYAVLAYLEEGNLCWVMRVGVECEEGQIDDLSNICIDTSGAKESGWGRIPVFKGIDFGKITTREVGTLGWSFHDQSLTFDEFNDSVIGTGTGTEGPSSAQLEFVGASYTGAIDDSFLVLITSAPTATSGSMLDGAGYSIIRSSDGAIVATGNLVESSTPNLSEDIVVTDGIIFQVRVLSGMLDVNDSFRFTVEPDNREFSFRINHEEIGGIADPEKPVTFTMPTATYTDASVMAAAINALTNGVGVDASVGNTMATQRYIAVANDDDTVSFRTETAGHSIQLIANEAFALEIGQSLYAFDIPRSNLIGINPGPYDITSDNNIVKINVKNGTDDVNEFTATIPVGYDLTPSTIASAINAAAIVLGETLVRAYALIMPGGEETLVIESTDDNPYAIITMMANGSNPKTIRFADEIGIGYPYTESYRGFSDSRETLPRGGEVDESNPYSCEIIGQPDYDAGQCQADQSYYENIVGWFIAPSPGTWVDNYRVDLDIYQGTNVPSGRYEIRVKDQNNVLLTRIQDVSFDPTSDRYIADLINPVDDTDDVRGNEYIRWLERPEFLGNDVDDPSTLEVRLPATFYTKSFDGQADGIPADPIYSSELDRVVIGNPALETGIYKFANPETYDISLMVTPGFSSGSVITTAFSVCTQRGDCLYIVDPPFGLNPQQIVDWHNGLLFTDLQVALDTSYGALYYPWVKVFDQFNGGDIWIPPSGHVAAVFARTDRVSEIWFAPAGLNRGKLITALDVEYQSSRGERDLMYGFNNAVNTILKYPQRGIHIWGQRTLQRRDSALDRVNVRMLLIAIKKALAGPDGLLNEYIFEPNDRITRSLVVSSIDNFMQDVATRRGVSAWKTICDDSNNTPIRIDRNELWIALLIKPVRAIEFIVLNIGILRTDQSFVAEEILAAVGVQTSTTV